jgi:dipeptidase
MCDTLVALGEATTDGSVILAKNSDRQPNEAHVLAHFPRTQHAPGSTVQCTYIEVPQVAETYEVLLSKPFWIWGCEMGVNECGLAIGNEAVFTKEPYGKEPGLIGMDFLRLALERAATARQALEVIVDLLAKHGQGGNCGFHHKEFYHNSFILADPGDAWVLETAGQYWAAERVRDIRTISNGLTIDTKWDLASPGLVEHAIEKGWCKSRDDFSFAGCYSDFLFTRFGACRARQCRSTELLEEQKGNISTATMMAALRDHGPQAAQDPAWGPGRGWLMDTLCVHAGFGPTRPSQSTGAMVAHLKPNQPTAWLTGSSATCTGVFKPVYLAGAGLPDLGPQPHGTYDAGSLWWAHERLHRAVILDYAARLSLYREERDLLEGSFLLEAGEVRKRYWRDTPEERAVRLADFTADCFRRAADATVGWTERVNSKAVQRRAPLWFTSSWNRFNKQAGFPEAN